MAKRIILKDIDLNLGSNPPQGYKFLGFDNGEFSERTADVVTKLNEDIEWIGDLSLSDGERGMLVIKNTTGFQFVSPTAAAKPGTGLYKLDYPLENLDPSKVHVVVTPRNTQNNLIISSIDSSGITVQVLDNQGSGTGAGGFFHVQIKYFGELSL